MHTVTHMHTVHIKQKAHGQKIPRIKHFYLFQNGRCFYRTQYGYRSPYPLLIVHPHACLQFWPNAWVRRGGVCKINNSNFGPRGASGPGPYKLPTSEKFRIIIGCDCLELQKCVRNLIRFQAILHIMAFKLQWNCWILLNFSILHENSSGLTFVHGTRLDSRWPDFWKSVSLNPLHQ